MLEETELELTMPELKLLYRMALSCHSEEEALLSVSRKMQKILETQLTLKELEALYKDPLK